MCWELYIIKHLQAYQNSIFDMFFYIISIFSSILGVIFVFFLLFFLFKKYFSFIFLICSAVTTTACYILKTTINRPRPYQLDLTILNKTNSLGKSYPSGHMTTGTLLVFFVCVFAIKKFKKTWQKVLTILLGFLYIILLAISRMYFGQHYATDLIIGSLFSLFFSYAVYFVASYFV